MTTAATGAGSVVGPTTPLRPAITRPMLTVFVIGEVLGAGIYALVGEVAGKVGGAIWTSFLVAFAVMCSGVASAATLATAFGGAYAGGLLALGVVLWGLSRALTGPAEPVDPATLVD
jgi:APA family basic amino acid/polyamine antiporter